MDLNCPVSGIELSSQLHSPTCTPHSGCTLYPQATAAVPCSFSNSKHDHLSDFVFLGFMRELRRVSEASELLPTCYRATGTASWAKMMSPSTTVLGKKPYRLRTVHGRVSGTIRLRRLSYQRVCALGRKQRAKKLQEVS